MRECRSNVASSQVAEIEVNVQPRLYGSNTLVVVVVAEIEVDVEPRLAVRYYYYIVVVVVALGALLPTTTTTNQT